MPINLHDDTSYKYRRDQRELLSKILSGTLDEDMCISNLQIDQTPPTNWKINPVFKGTCFTGKHSLSVYAYSSVSNNEVFNGLFANIVNVTHLLFSFGYTGTAKKANYNLGGICNRAKDLITVELRCNNDKTGISGMHTGFLNTDTLKTVILRGSSIGINSNHFINSSNVETLVFDSPSMVPLTDIGCMYSSAFKSGGTGGTIYIPKSLYDHLGDGTEYDYKAATNWSTLDGYGTVTWAQIEGSEYEL